MIEKRLGTMLMAVALLGAACGSSADSEAATTVSTVASAAAETTAGTETTVADLGVATALDAWIVNDGGATAAVIGDGVEVNVQSVEVETIDGVEYMVVTATGIPDYTHTITESDQQFLENRPNAVTDFTSGGLLVTVGDSVEFGEDIGYNSTGCTNEDGSGYGYWPPGPACPTEQTYEISFPLQPQLAAGDHTATGLGTIGLWVNGVAIFNWGDGQSYQNSGVWQNLAPVAESYDLDICPGHSAMGQYHHHSHPTCLADLVGDDGSGHSPIYGFAADGFAVYGPWVADGTLARSSWVIRDYDDPDSATGCGEVGVRSCLLVDHTDPTAGTVEAAVAGPSTSATMTSLSGNTFDTTAGFYMEDYYFDAALDDGTLQALDQHNGHDHDGLGYHYHVARADDGSGSLVDVFPYYIGVEFAGVVQGAATTTAQAAGGGAAPGGAQPAADDLLPVADALGVTVDELMAALGQPPPDLAAAAAALGVTERDLADALTAAGVGPPG